MASNPGFETAGGAPPVFANWDEVIGDGAIANEGVIIHEGADAAKITSGATANTLLHQSAAVVPGARYRLRIWTQGDGANDGRYIIYDVTNGADIVPSTGTGVTGAAYGMVAREFTAPAGCVSARFILRGPAVNGGICYFDACEVRRMDGFLGDQGTIIVPAQVANAGVWTDGITRRLLRIGVDANNYIQIARGANNQIGFTYIAGGISETQVAGGLVNIDFASYGMTWDISAGATGEVMYYIRGVPSGGTDVGLGTWVGGLSNTQTVIGAISTIPANVWSGNIGPAAVWSAALTPDEMRYLGT